MANRTLISVGYEIPGYSDQFLSLSSDRSLLDADVILFQPDLPTYRGTTTYMGKPCLGDDASAALAEQLPRWRHELVEALKAGKTVFVYLSAVEDVYVGTGEKRYSGTGRNQKTTRIVAAKQNYEALPFDLGTVIPRGGTNIRIAKDLKQLADYWREFGEHSAYELYMNNPKGTPILTASSPEAVVGLIVRSTKGTAVLLPPVQYDRDEFVTENAKGEHHWTKQALAFGNRLMAALLEADRVLRADAEITPAPTWATAPEHRLSSEIKLETELHAKDAAIEQLRHERASLESRIADASSLRDLLYETGRPLERAIVKALKVMGFDAAPFKADGSEFDAVFVSEEGRFIGEAEGKNDRAINIEKLDQLERNVREDFDRESSGRYAKAVLFGNAYRLKEPARRDNYFTEKCYAAAARGKVALVRTPDLFAVARHLDEHADPDFARACRVAILQAEGTLVTFPTPPNARL